jgi:hypothetical protein
MYPRLNRISTLSLISRFASSAKFRFWLFIDKKLHSLYGWHVRKEVKSLLSRKHQPFQDDRGVLITSYSNNAIPRRVVSAQDEFLKALLQQYGSHRYHWLPLKSKSRAMHYQWIDSVLAEAFKSYSFVILLDVDCIPYSMDALDLLVEWSDLAKVGGVAGVEQISPGHNTGHYYVSPVACCISEGVFRAIGCPSAIQDLGGDVMESFTYSAERNNVSVRLIRVVDVVGPKLWSFPDGRAFGIGTVYGIDGKKLFFHNFCSSTKPSKLMGSDHTHFFCR